MVEFYAAAIPGTEKVLCEELRKLGFASVRLNRGGIPFRGEPAEGWRACLLAGAPEYEREFAAIPHVKQPLSNGDIDCVFLVYDVQTSVKSGCFEIWRAS